MAADAETMLAVITVAVNRGSTTVASGCDVDTAPNKAGGGPGLTAEGSSGPYARYDLVRPGFGGEIDDDVPVVLRKDLVPMEWAVGSPGTGRPGGVTR